MSDWTDHEAGRTGVNVSQLADGESVTCQGAGEPFRRDTSESDDALHVPVQFLETPEDFVDMSENEIDDETKEYNIINSSTSFFEAMLSVFEDTPMAGQSFEITAHQPDDVYSRYYEIEIV